ncbi:MAG: adenylate/guanylate cyclase domain-containing protein [Pseudomonadota bacterium]
MAISHRSASLAVVFADVVGSTRLYEQLGDAKARDTVARCLRVMTRATEAQDGRVVKTMGDEVMATFETAGAAVEAAMLMQAMIKEHLREAGVPVDIRIGLHYGPVMEEEDDIFGSTVHTANRMTSQAKAQQIVTTGATVDLLPAHLQSATRQIDFAQVKGRSDGIAVFEVLWQRDDTTTMLPALDELMADATNSRRLVLQYQGKSFTVDGKVSQARLGRAENSDLVVKDTLISRFHARIEYERGRFMLYDESTNGTCVIMENGEELYVRRDRLQIEGRGIIGLGRVAKADTVHTVSFELVDDDNDD